MAQTLSIFFVTNSVSQCHRLIDVQIKEQWNTCHLFLEVELSNFALYSSQDQIKWFSKYNCVNILESEV